MAPFINFIASFLLMLVTGAFFGPWLALTRSLKNFNADEFIKITRTLSGNLGPIMRFLLPASILMMMLATLYHPETFLYLRLIAIALLITSLIITVIVEVPIVKSIEHCTAATLPADWEERRNRWIRFHVLRMLAALLSFGLWLAV